MLIHVARTLLMITIAFALASCGGGDGDSTSDEATATIEATATAVPPPPGWREFNFEGVSLALPPRFAGGPLNATQTAATIAELAPLGGACEGIESGLESPPLGVVFFVVDSVDCVDDFVTNLNIAKVPTQGDPSIEFVVDGVVERLPERVTHASDSVVTLGGVEVGLVETSGGNGLTQDIYLVLDEGHFWSMTLTMSPGDSRSPDDMLLAVERFAVSLEAD